jgi:hypothetical protein
MQKGVEVHLAVPVLRLSPGALLFRRRNWSAFWLMDKFDA